METAKTILAQLGGNKFIVMTGARNLLGSDDSLSMKVGRNDKGVTHVRITLTPADVYAVKFMAVRGTNVRELAAVDGVYCDDLRRTFEEHTGMRTSL